MKKILALALSCAMFLSSVGCSSQSTWATIIGVASSLSAVVSVFDPGVGTLSSLAVRLLTDAEQAVLAAQKDKSATNLQKVADCLQAIETQLPEAEAQLHVQNTADAQKVNAAVEIILNFVEAEAQAQGVPLVIQAQAKQARAARGVSAPAKQLSSKEIKKAFEAQVCQGDKVCANKLQ